MYSLSKRALALCASTLALTVLACDSEQTMEPTEAPALRVAPAPAPSEDLVAEVRRLARERGIGRLERPAPVRPALARLGQMLLFDKVLSGNRDISCMTCHLPRFATGDARSLSIGQGATGLGPRRVHPATAFIPRNAPPLFNLTALKSLFWDGRIFTDSRGRLQTPAGDKLTPRMRAVFEFGAVSAIGLFPVLSREEMRAFRGNELAAIPDDNQPAVWRGLMNRLGQIPRYRRMFEEAYPRTRFEDMTFAHASNAMAGFMVGQLSLVNSPWDRFLRGESSAMNQAQLTGARSFLTFRCSICHNGPAFTDNDFHNVALAQLGPGQGDGPSGKDDFGRMRVTGRAPDRYRFRTTALRNVDLTGPFGHDGAISGLRDFIAHYSESDVKLRTFDPLTLEPLLQGTVLVNPDAILATRDTLLNGVVVPDGNVDELTTFMGALTDPVARNLGFLRPSEVPSRLPVD